MWQLFRELVEPDPTHHSGRVWCHFQWCSGWSVVAPFLAFFKILEPFSCITFIRRLFLLRVVASPHSPQRACVGMFWLLSRVRMKSSPVLRSSLEELSTVGMDSIIYVRYWNCNCRTRMRMRIVDVVAQGCRDAIFFGPVGEEQSFRCCVWLIILIELLVYSRHVLWTLQTNSHPYKFLQA